MYVDDILIFDKIPNMFRNMFKDRYNVKPSNISVPKSYLDTDVDTVSYSNGTYIWTMSSITYVKDSVKHLKAQIKQKGFIYNKKVSDINHSPK